MEVDRMDIKGGKPEGREQFIFFQLVHEQPLNPWYTDWLLGLNCSFQLKFEPLESKVNL